MYCFVKYCISLLISRTNKTPHSYCQSKVRSDRLKPETSVAVTVPVITFPCKQTEMKTSLVHTSHFCVAVQIIQGCCSAEN